MPIIGFPATLIITTLFQLLTIPQVDRKKRSDLFAMQLLQTSPLPLLFEHVSSSSRSEFWGYSQQDRIDSPQKSCYKIGYSPLS